MSDLSFGDGNIIEFVRIIQILDRGYQVLFCQQQIEEISDRRDRYTFHTFDIGCLCLLVTDRLDPAVPFLVVHSEDRLRQGQADRYTHIFIESSISQLAGEIKGRIQRYFTTGQRYILIDRDRTAHRQVIILHKGIGSVRLLVTGILLTITGDRSFEINLRQLVGYMGTVFPVGRFQLIQSDGGIYRLVLCQ